MKEYIAALERARALRKELAKESRFIKTRGFELATEKTGLAPDDLVVSKKSGKTYTIKDMSMDSDGRVVFTTRNADGRFQLFTEHYVTALSINKAEDLK